MGRQLSFISPSLNGSICLSTLVADRIYSLNKEGILCTSLDSVSVSVSLSTNEAAV